MGLVRVPALEVLSDQPAEPSEQNMPQFGDRALIPALASSWSYRLAVGRRGDCRPPHPLEDASDRAANAGVEPLATFRPRGSPKNAHRRKLNEIGVRYRFLHRALNTVTYSVIERDAERI